MTHAFSVIIYSSLILPFCSGFVFLDILHLFRQTIAVGVKMTINTIVTNIVTNTVAAASFLPGKETSIFPGIEVEVVPRYNEDGCGMTLGVDSTLVEEWFSTTSGTSIDPRVSADKTLISFEWVDSMFGIDDTVLVEVLVGQMLGLGSIDKVVVVTVAGVVSLQPVMRPS